MGAGAQDREWHGAAYLVAVGSVRSTKNKKEVAKKNVSSEVARLSCVSCAAWELMLFECGLKMHTDGQNPSMQMILTMLPHHVRVDGCMCGVRELAH